MARFWWVFALGIAAAGYFVGWPEVKPKIDAYRAEKLAEELCEQASRRVNGGSAVRAIHEDTREAFQLRAARNKLVFDDTIGTPIVVNDRSCVLSATLVTMVNGKVKRNEIRREWLW